MIPWNGPGDRRFTRHPKPGPAAVALPAWLPEDRAEYAELLYFAMAEHARAQTQTQRATIAYRNAHNHAGDPRELLALRVMRALSVEAVRIWALEVAGIFDLMRGLGMHVPPAAGGES